MSQDRKVFRLAFSIPITVATLALGFSLVPPAASASPKDSSGAPTEIVESGMRLVGFDPDVARAHGYEVVTLPDGSQASVPADKAEAARNGDYVPAAGVLKAGEGSDGGALTYAYESKNGDCGMSFVGLNAQGSARATLHTGMELTADAGSPLIVSWGVAISDAGGNSTQSYGESDGNTSGRSWLAHLRMLYLTIGNAVAGVTTSSWTITTGGWFCFSYGPSVTEFIY